MSEAALVLGIGLLGGVGALARFLLDGAVQRRLLGVFPAGTLAVNLSGSFLLGLLVGLGVAGDGLLLAGTAALGSFTTFSTWLFETHRALQDGQQRVAAANVGVSLGLGFAALVLGRALGGLA